MTHSFEPRDRCTERLLAAVNRDPWLLRYALAMCCMNMELGALNELVYEIETADKALVAADKQYLTNLVRERFGL